MPSARHGPRAGARPQRFSFWVDRTTPHGPVLLRYDLRGQGQMRGARLGVDGRWHASRAAERLMWLGAGPGEPLDLEGARAVAAELGHPDLDLSDPHILP